MSSYLNHENVSKEMFKRYLKLRILKVENNSETNRKHIYINQVLTQERSISSHDFEFIHLWI